MPHDLNSNNVVMYGINGSIITDTELVLVSAIVVESLWQYAIDVLLKPAYFLDDALSN